MKPHIVKYQGKCYKVLESSFIGDSNLYKLQSSNAVGSPFSAKKSECEDMPLQFTTKHGYEVYWSEAVRAFVSIPE